MTKFVHVDFVIKFLHGMTVTVSNEIFGQGLKGGNLIVCFLLNS
jgi:hypothetical protein